MELDGGLKIYLREIGKIDLLTPEQEVELAERIKRGDPEARSHMISANLRLVVKIAQDYANYGLPLLDLISEGNIGLMKAVERFDPNKGGKLSTYATWWIKQSIKHALANQSKTIRLPVPMVDKISKMRRVAIAMSQELCREPTDDELSKEIGIDRVKLSQLKAASLRPDLLDARISDNDSSEFGEIVGDENAQTPFDLFSHNNMHSQFDGLLTVLDERERKIIEARFGLAGQTPRPLEEVGEEFGVTRERIRELQNIALCKIRQALQKKVKQPSTALRASKPLEDFELQIEQQERFALLALKNTEATLSLDEMLEFENLRQDIRRKRNLTAPLPIEELQSLKINLQQEINQNAKQESSFGPIQL